MQRRLPILIGLMGAGKTHIGRLLARRLQAPFIDLDEWIVRQEGMSIPEIFERFGERGFRERETTALRELVAKPVVLATGGGVVMREENRHLLRRHPPVVWLRAEPEVLAKRIDGDANRPLIASGGTLARLEELSAVRTPLYQSCADFIVDTDMLTPEQACQSILDFLSSFEAAPGE
ncbi:MAG: shikimate kinase [Zetaproteobacteria bacterium]|nr:MAG: shikimate kinase [Zetaproteobacteria bacterium]